MVNLQKIYDEIKHIGQWFSYQDLEEFAKLDLPKTPVILELGTGSGRSSRAMKRLWPDAKIYTCDLVISNVVGTDGVWYAQSTSHDLEWDKECDLIFVDSSHTYEETKKEIKKFKPFVKKGGYMVFHDYEGTGVKKAVDELIDDFLIVKTGDYSQAIWRNQWE